MNRILILLLLACATNHVSHAQESKPVLTFKSAQKILAGSVAYADSAKLNMAIAIYNTEGEMICFGRMSGTVLGVSKVAQWKGVSAASYQASTEETGTWNVNNAPDIATIPGGLPIFTSDGICIGGIGVSGAAAAVDVKCAEAGLKAAGLKSKK